MATVFDVLMMVLLLAVAAYAHLRLGYHTATQRQALVARAALLLVGLGLGWTAATLWIPAASSAAKTVAFLSAFGIVHVPAAVVLFIKRRRGVYQ